MKSTHSDVEAGILPARQPTGSIGFYLVANGFVIEFSLTEELDPKPEIIQ